MAVRPEEFVNTARRLYPTQVEWRRHLHEHPEVSNQEFETTEYLRKYLTRLGVTFLPVKTQTGLLVDFSGGRPGPTVAVRTDIDALPITEQNEIPFKSKRLGVMHACGHDVHMATVLGVATLLSKQRKELRGTYRFIFQPAEEMPPGGAVPMIESGALKDVGCILGLHVYSLLDTGKIGLLDGIAMASVYDFDLMIHGKSSHAARPQDGVDAIVIAAEIIQSLQTIVSREVNPLDPVVITFGQIQGGTARNVIVDRVTLRGTARTLSAATQKRVPQLVKRTAQNIARARGGRCDIHEVASYPALKNDPRVNRLLAHTSEILFGKGHVCPTTQSLGAEDFASYLERVPGAMFRLGVRNRKLKADQPWHSPLFMADEESMVFGTALLAAAAASYCESGRL